MDDLFQSCSICDDILLVEEAHGRAIFGKTNTLLRLLRNAEGKERAKFIFLRFGSASWTGTSATGGDLKSCFVVAVSSIQRGSRVASFSFTNQTGLLKLINARKVEELWEGTLNVSSPISLPRGPRGPHGFLV